MLFCSRGFLDGFVGLAEVWVVCADVIRGREPLLREVTLTTPPVFLSKRSGPWKCRIGGDVSGRVWAEPELAAAGAVLRLRWPGVVKATPDRGG